MIVAEPKHERYPAQLASTSIEQCLFASELVRRTSTLETNKALPSDWLEYLSTENDRASFLAFYNDVLGLTVSDDDEAPASAHALEFAIDVSQEVCARLSTAWSNPRVATDGGGGVRLTWKTQDTEVRAVIPAHPNRPQYLYVEKHETHYTIRNFTSMTLYEELKSR